MEDQLLNFFIIAYCAYKEGDIEMIVEMFDGVDFYLENEIFLNE